MRFLPLLALLLFSAQLQGQSYTLGLLKYGGGGDWYANPTALPNLITFCNRELGTTLAEEPATVDAGSPDVFNFPLLHMTGHGNVFFSPTEIRNLRLYLEAGGFLHIDDNYGMDPYIRRELKKLFPELDLVSLPPDHPLFRSPYEFPEGLPKIHVHDNRAPGAYGLFYQGRLVVLYTHECDLGDGWEDPEVHNDPPEVRLNALRMGANIVNYVFNGQYEKP